jgi:tRNA (adenine-N(1)-)-methyltransferase non-catalytic subunit
LQPTENHDDTWSAEVASQSNGTGTNLSADALANGQGKTQPGHERPETSAEEERPRKRRAHPDDFDIHYAQNNTITLIHQNPQANLSLLKYYDYDHADPSPSYPYHPLFTNLLPLTWLQLLQPEDDLTYSENPPDVSAEELASWKTTRRGNYHRKRRRWARTRHIVDQARSGNFSGLAVASTMDPISVLRNTLPLLAGGAPIAIYSPNIEPLSQLMDCFTVARRAAWVSDPPVEIQGKTTTELETWEGSPEFPINPTLLLGAAVQTSRGKRWQVLPGRTHPMMTGRGGAEGYLFTGWRAIPVEGKVSARGKFNKKKTEA